MKEAQATRRRTVLLILASLIVLITAYKAVRLYPIAQRLKQHGQNLIALRDLSPDLLVNEPALTGIAADLAGMENALTDLKKAASLELGLLSFLSWVPEFGGDLATLPVLLDLGIAGSAAGHKAINGILPVIALGEERPLAERALALDPAVAAALEQAQPYFQQALPHFDQVLATLDELENLPPAVHIDPRLQPYLDKAEPLLPIARLGLETAGTSPAVIDAAMGLTRPRRYLVLLQNNWEIRATGGFITAAVIVTVHGGEIEFAPFIDSYDIDLQIDSLPPPPDSLRKAMWAGVWTFRDANWSPDFPTSAQWARELYQIGRDETIDGVIALDPVAIQYLLKAIGPINVPDFETSVTAQNMWDQLAAFHDVPPGFEQEDDQFERLGDRKAFLALVAEPLLAKLLASKDSPQTLVNLAQELLKALDERHLLIAIPKAPVDRWLAENQWDGAVWQGAGDYLQIVDSNVGYNKADARITRNIDYQVHLEPDGDAIAQVTINYHNNSTVQEPESCVQQLVYGGYGEGWVEACYWSFVRVFVPAGSQLLSSNPQQWPETSLWRRENPSAGDPGVLISAPQNDKQSFGLMLVVPPGQEINLIFRYRLPIGVWDRDNGYRLYFQKQSGTIETPVQIDIHLPQGIEMVKSNGASTGGRLASAFSLRKDEMIQVQLSGQIADSLSVRPTNIPSPLATLPPTLTATLTRTETPTPGPSPTPVVLLALAQRQARVTATPTENVPVAATPIAAERATWAQVEIPKAQIDGSIVEVGWKLVGPPEARRAEWEVAAFAAGHHKDSAYPGEMGNVVLSGHHNILGEVFRDLWILEPGDTIDLTDSNGVQYRYMVQSVNILPELGASSQVRALYLQFIQQKPEPILTLVTCWPYETNTHRTIVVANLLP